MKMAKIRTTPIYVLTCALGLLFLIAGCSSSDDAPPPVVDDGDTQEFVTVSGIITDINDAAEPDVVVEGVGDPSNPTDTTDSNGAFSLQVLKNSTVFMHATKDTFATINTQKGVLTIDVLDLNIGIPTVTEAQGVIDLAFGEATTPLQNKAWLVVDIEDENGDQVSGKTIISSPAPAAFVYTECDGTNGGSTTTVACDDRDGPMYIAYFDDPGDASVTVDSETQIAPMRSGEITFLEFEVATVTPPPTPSAGQLIYDADCASCHKAGSYDTDGSNSDVIDTGFRLIADVSLSYLHPQMSGIILTQQEVDDLAAFLDDEITPAP
jgi:hypothetical protein